MPTFSLSKDSGPLLSTLLLSRSHIVCIPSIFCLLLFLNPENLIYRVIYCKSKKGYRLTTESARVVTHKDGPQYTLHVTYAIPPLPVLPLVANYLSAPEGKTIQASQHLADALHFTAGCVRWPVLNLFSLLSLSWNRNSTLISVVYKPFPQVSSPYRGLHPPRLHSKHTPVEPQAGSTGCS